MTAETDECLLRKHEEEITKLKQQLATKNNELRTCTKMVEERDKTINALQNSSSWKITLPLRAFGTGMRTLLKYLTFVKYLPKAIRSLRLHGWKATRERVRNRLKRGKPFRIKIDFSLSEDERCHQNSASFAHGPLISILVPLYNTPRSFLEDMINSVLNQTYAQWELCLADASDRPLYHPLADEMPPPAGGPAPSTPTPSSDAPDSTLASLFSDPRIHYRHLAQNGGISANTNEALALATGDYFALLDHDDVLHPSALYEMAKAIDATGADMLYSDEATFERRPEDAYYAHFKPDFSPDTLRSYNYITHLLVFSRSLQQRVGVFRSAFDGSQDYDMILRLSEQAQHVVHLPKVLYFWRAHKNSVASGIEAKTYATAAAKGALTEHLQRVGLEGAIYDATVPTVYRIVYKIKDAPLVSIIIPNKDHIDDLDTCLRSLQEKTTYPHYEIIIAENNSVEDATFEYYRTLTSCENSPIRLHNYEGGFNFPAINNFAAHCAQGTYLLFLNNDTEVITPQWIEEMLMFAQRPEVAAVGAKLLYPDNTVQHAGVILGIGGIAGHSHKNFARDEFGYASRLQLAQNLTAVSAACLLVSADKFWEVDGFDEGYAVAFNDVDLCMKMRTAGYLNIYTPFAELYHHESKSRGYEDTPEKQTRFSNEIARFATRWEGELAAGDPYYNPHLTLVHEDFSLREYRS
jgi:GT2 family glycosyltransferase